MATGDKYDLEGWAIDTEKNLIQAAWKIGLVIALEATDFAAPGWSGQLKRSIKSTKPKVLKDEILVLVKAFAKDAQGNNYAYTQHESILRHLNKLGTKARTGYADKGEGRTLEARYIDGYNKLKKTSPKYANKFLEIGLDAADPQINKLMGKI